MYMHYRVLEDHHYDPCPEHFKITMAMYQLHIYLTVNAPLALNASGSRNYAKRFPLTSPFFSYSRLNNPRGGITRLE